MHNSADKKVLVVVAHVYSSVTVQRQTLNIGRSLQWLLLCNDYFVLGGIRICLEVYSDPMFLWNSSNSCPLNLLLVRSHQVEIIIAKRLIQERNNVTRVWVEPRSCNQDRRKNDAFTLSATLMNKINHVNNGYRSNDLNNLYFLEQACTTYGPAKPFIAVLEMISRVLKHNLFQAIHICRIVM